MGIQDPSPTRVFERSDSDVGQGGLWCRVKVSALEFFLMQTMFL